MAFRKFQVRDETDGQWGVVYNDDAKGIVTVYPVIFTDYNKAVKCADRFERNGADTAGWKIVAKL